MHSQQQPPPVRCAHVIPFLRVTKATPALRRLTAPPPLCVSGCVAPPPPLIAFRAPLCSGHSIRTAGGGAFGPGSPTSAMVELTEIDTTVASDDADLGAGLSLGSSSRGLESIESASDAGGDPLPPPLPAKRQSKAGSGSGTAELAAGIAAAQQLLQQQQQKWARGGGGAPEAAAGRGGKRISAASSGGGSGVVALPF